MWSAQVQNGLDVIAFNDLAKFCLVQLGCSIELPGFDGVKISADGQYAAIGRIGDAGRASAKKDDDGRLPYSDEPRSYVQ